MLNNNLYTNGSVIIKGISKNQHTKQMKIIIIANRLPVKIEREDNAFVVKRSEGGLATGLGSLETDAEMHWIGWPGIYTDD